MKILKAWQMRGGFQDQSLAIVQTDEGMRLITKYPQGGRFVFSTHITLGQCEQFEASGDWVVMPAEQLEEALRKAHPGITADLSVSMVRMQLQTLVALLEAQSPQAIAELSGAIAPILGRWQNST